MSDDERSSDSDYESCEEEKNDSIEDMIEESKYMLKSLKSLTKKHPIYRNQKIAAEQIMHSFVEEGVLICLGIGEMQSGKTGVAIECIRRSIILFLRTKNPKYYIPKENIFIITGMSDNNWVDLITDRCPDFLKNVYHRNTLLKVFTKKVKKISNIFIIIDETHIASSTENTIFKAFQLAGLLDSKELIKRNINVLQLTATPEDLLYDVKKWNKYSKTIYLEPGHGYVGLDKLYQNGNLMETINLFKENISSGTIQNSDEIIDNYTQLTTDMINNPNQQIAIMRVNSSKDIITSLKYIRYITEKFNIKIDIMLFITYKIYLTIKSDRYVSKMRGISHLDDLDDLNKFLGKPPVNVTYLIVIDRIACAQTLDLTYVAFMCDNNSMYKTLTTTVQSFAGRACGYHNPIHTTVVFTNLKNVKKYIGMSETKFQVDEKYKPKQETFIHPKHYGIEVKTKETADEEIMRSFICKHFDSEDELFVECVKLFGTQTVNKKKTFSKIRFYNEAIGKHYSVEEAEEKGRHELFANLKENPNSKARYLIGYTDMNNSRSAKHILIYKPVIIQTEEPDDLGDDESID